MTGACLSIEYSTRFGLWGLVVDGSISMTGSDKEKKNPDSAEPRKGRPNSYGQESINETMGAMINDTTTSTREKKRPRTSEPTAALGGMNDNQIVRCVL